MECSWEKCTNLVEWNKWRRNNLEKYLKRNQSHIIVAIKVHDEKKNKDTELTFIDIIGFDRSFTDRIMNGETDADFEEGVDNKNGKDFRVFNFRTIEINIHWDLFALRNLLLAIDQARTEGYELNDVSLTEERCIAKVISHKLRMDNKIHLIGFASDDNDWFQQTLNTLEFWLKFKSCLSPEIGRNLNIQVISFFSLKIHNYSMIRILRERTRKVKKEKENMFKTHQTLKGFRVIPHHFQEDLKTF